MAAHDGRLATVRGFGKRRVRGVWTRWRPASGVGAVPPPPVPALRASGGASSLDVAPSVPGRSDGRPRLRRIAPRRFNPGMRPWLPILHTERGDRHYTALFSNTARAHERGRTGDWVVIYLDDGGSERQATVVTETHGPLAGRRVVRGHERECAAHYAEAAHRRSADGTGGPS